MGAGGTSGVDGVVLHGELEDLSRVGDRLAALQAAVGVQPARRQWRRGGGGGVSRLDRAVSRPPSLCSLRPPSRSHLSIYPSLCTVRPPSRSHLSSIYPSLCSLRPPSRSHLSIYPSLCSLRPPSRSYLSSIYPSLCSLRPPSRSHLCIYPSRCRSARKRTGRWRPGKPCPTESCHIVSLVAFYLARGVLLLTLL